MSRNTTSETEIVVREVREPEEREAIFRLRYDVYVEEMGFASCRGADPVRRRLVDERDSTGHVLGAYDGDTLVGTIRVDRGDDGGFDDDFHATYMTPRFAQSFGRWGYCGRLMVTPGRRGGPALQALVTAHYRLALELGIAAEFLHAAPGLVQLYERLGCRRYAPNFRDPELGYRVPMVLILGDAARFGEVSSPFARILEEHSSHRAPAAALRWFETCFGAVATSEFLLGEEAFWDYLADKISTGGLARSPLLAGLTDEQAADVLGACIVLRFNEGDHVLRAGHSGREMFLLLSGAVAVRRGDGAVVTRLEAGQVFGEVGFIANARRSADVVGVEAGELLVVTQQRLRSLMAEQPAIAAKVLLNLARLLCERGAWSANPRPAGSP